MTREALLQEIVILNEKWDLKPSKLEVAVAMLDGSVLERITSVDQWLIDAPDEWFPLALDLINNPPDLSGLDVFKNSSKDDETEEFLITMEHLLGAWYSYHPALWLQEMTPMLSNELTRSPGARYRSACEMALHLARLASSRAPVTLIEPMIEWLEPLWAHRKKLTKDEFEAYEMTLINMFNAYALPHSRFCLTLSGYKPLGLRAISIHPKIPEDSDKKE